MRWGSRSWAIAAQLLWTIGCATAPLEIGSSSHPPAVVAWNDEEAAVAWIDWDGRGRSGVFAAPVERRTIPFRLLGQRVSARVPERGDVTQVSSLGDVRQVCATPIPDGPDGTRRLAIFWGDRLLDQVVGRVFEVQGQRLHPLGSVVTLDPGPSDLAPNFEAFWDASGSRVRVSYRESESHGDRIHVVWALSLDDGQLVSRSLNRLAIDLPSVVDIEISADSAQVAWTEGAPGPVRTGELRNNLVGRDIVIPRVDDWRIYAAVAGPRSRTIAVGGGNEGDFLVRVIENGTPVGELIPLPVPSRNAAGLPARARAELVWDGARYILVYPNVVGTDGARLGIVQLLRFRLADGDVRTERIGRVERVGDSDADLAVGDGATALVVRKRDRTILFRWVDP